MRRLYHCPSARAPVAQALPMRSMTQIFFSIESAMQCRNFPGQLSEKEALSARSNWHSPVTRCQLRVNVDSDPLTA